MLERSSIVRNLIYICVTRNTNFPFDDCCYANIPQSNIFRISVAIETSVFSRFTINANELNLLQYCTLVPATANEFIFPSLLEMKRAGNKSQNSVFHDIGRLRRKSYTCDGKLPIMMVSAVFI